MYEALLGIMVLGFIGNNLVWLLYLRKYQKDVDEQIQTLLNRIQAPTYITPVKTDKKESPKRPSMLDDQSFDPEYEAVGKINPDHIENHRNGN